ncbi:hypothetical protein EOA32_01075 [Mesorhizobium sp. M1A.F.Ca.ET.072.01.1.1]|uniref:hypothetical protein n=1 Tax=Mesorhizobium sp. M1A.F.Ca.ET.072.01.1.1 TaxID=2496753 RepID=UPI000FD3A8D4|nr:hypothetical protein [Mesorhizobium sp. M1A.F.Ca.ET.072.01.1.1]RUW55642.1 hypothetical protein EOA32_01075 [Mesorhizobium sp. M1A.F.Ca.ET.072.01.1.1]
MKVLRTVSNEASKIARDIMHERLMPMGKYQLVNKDGRIDIMVNRSRVVGYVEDDTLTALDAQGYAVQIGAINHRAEIIGKLDAWRQTHLGGMA